MLTLLAATPNWWDMPGYSCLRQVRMDKSKDVDLDVLQAAINLSHRDKFLRDRVSRRVAMKRLYQRHPVSTLCQEGVSKCSDMMGATFILFLILYRICSKRSQAQVARIKTRNRAAVVRAVKADHLQFKGGTVAKPCRHKSECSSVTSDKVKVVDCMSKDRTVDRSNHKASCSSKVIAATTPTLAEGAFDVRGHVRYLRAIIHQHLLLSGDIELNPGPPDDIEQILSTVDATTFSEDDWNIVMRECHSLSAKWQQLCGYLGLPIGLIDSIKGNYPNDNSACWREALKQWIQQNYNTVRFGLPSWRTLLEAIARENRLLFKTLADNHQISAASTSEETVKKMTTSQEKLEIGDKEVSPLSKAQKKKRKRKRKPRMITLGPEARHTEDADVQQIIVAAHNTVSGESACEQPTLIFQCVSLEGMGEEEKKQFYQTLYTESVEMMFKFQKLFSSTTVSLNKRKISSQDICSRVQCLGSLTPVFEDSGLPVFRQQIPKLQQARSVDDAMSIINGYCSFFNFHILELIIEQLGSPEDTANLSKYKEEFNEYAKHHVFQCPSEVGVVTSGDAKMFVTLDETFNKCSLSTLHLFCSSLRDILNLSPGSGLKLCQIEPGSLKLTFQLPFSLLQGTFPLTEEQESAMARLGVEKLWLIYTFNKQHIQEEEEEETTGIDPDKTLETDEETADSASDKDEEEATDSDLDKREDAVAAGIDLVSMMNVIKLDDASSIADSALATSIATFTGVSQYSEDIVLRDLRDEPYLRMEHDAAKLQPLDDSSGLELHQASRRGEIDKVKQLVESQHVNPLLKDKYGDTALHYAAMGGDLSIMKYFTEEQGLSPACQGQYGRTTLHHAAVYKHLELVKYLVVEQQVDLLCKDEDWGYTSLHTACIGGDMEVIQFLINESQKYVSLEDVINERDKNGHTPFHIAAGFGHLPVVKFFITELNFDHNTPGFMGRPALHAAAQEGHLEVVSYLIEETKCDPSCCPGEDKETPLHMAAKNGRLDVVRYLTQKHHCNPLSRDSHGNTPLHNAALHGHFKVVEFLISELNCNPNTPGQWGRRPLHDACQAGSMDIVKYLIEQMNCNASQLDEQQVTPLHCAAMGGHLHVVKYLIQDKLCNPLCHDRVRNTPLHLAAREGHLEVVQYYIQSIRSSPNIRGGRNMTPLERARSNGHTHVVNYLESLSTV